MSLKTKSSLLTHAFMRRWGLPPVDAGADKDGKGRAFMMSGCREMPGAAIMTANAVLRAGAGKLQVATTQSVAPLVASWVPESYVVGCAETRAGAFVPASFARLSPHVEKADAVLIGPGLSAADSVLPLIKKLLRLKTESTFILDAQALKIFSPKLSFPKLPRFFIVTPHAGEMANMTGQSKRTIEANPEKAALDFSQSCGGVVVMKGPVTYIADPSGRLLTNRRGNSGLAISGSGDCLAGIITGLAARGAPPLQAAAWGVYLHALAGESLAKKYGPLGYLARELPHEIPALMAKLN